MTKICVNDVSDNLRKEPTIIYYISYILTKVPIFQVWLMSDSSHQEDHFRDNK